MTEATQPNSLACNADTTFAPSHPTNLFPSHLDPLLSSPSFAFLSSTILTSRLLGTSYRVRPRALTRSERLLQINQRSNLTGDQPARPESNRIRCRDGRRRVNSPIGKRRRHPTFASARPPWPTWRTLRRAKGRSREERERIECRKESRGSGRRNISYSFWSFPPRGK